MKHGSLKLRVLILLGLGLTELQAQQSINTSGGVGTGIGGSVTYSVGQMVYETSTGASAVVTQGVQQPSPASSTFQTAGNWNTSSNWTAGIPTSLTDAVVNATCNVDGSVPSQNLTVNPGVALTIASGNTLAVNGNLLLKSDAANGTATLVDNGVLTVTGTSGVEQYLTARTWYLSSPVSAATKTPILTASGSSTMVGYDEATATWPTADATLAVGKGYVLAPLSSIKTITFSGGAFNTGAQTVSLTRTTGQTKEGFNLIGNPYPSCLNAMPAINANANLEKTIWYRTKGAAAYVFESVNTSSGFGTHNAGMGDVSGYIPPLQSFWVRATANTTLNFATTDRSHTTASTTLLRAPAVASQLLRLQVSNGTNNDETLIYFNANAADGLDNYDSKKMSNGDASVPEIYTTVGGEKLVINGMKNIPTGEVALGLTPGQASTFTIKATEFSHFDANMHVILKDKLTGAEQDLTTADAYTFTSSVASVADRFSVVFKSAGTATGTIDATDNLTISVYRNAANQIAVQLQSAVSSNAVATVYNSVGQRLESTQLKNTTTIVGKSLTSGAYVVTVVNGGKTVTRKITIK